MIDELARRPRARTRLAFRLARLGQHPRHAAALKLAADKAGWTSPSPGSRAAAAALAVHEILRHRGRADRRGHGGRRHKLTVDRVVCAVDCGIAVTPDVVRAQMQSGIWLRPLGRAARARSRSLTDTSTRRNFHQYQVLRMSEDAAAHRGSTSCLPPATLRGRRAGHAPDRTGGCQRHPCGHGSAPAVAAVRSLGTAQGLGAPRDPVSSGRGVHHHRRRRMAEAAPAGAKQPRRLRDSALQAGAWRSASGTASGVSTTCHMSRWRGSSESAHRPRAAAPPTSGVKNPPRVHACTIGLR